MILDWKSPLAANEVPGTRGGFITGVEGEETVTWLVQTDSAFETMATIVAYGVLPPYLSPHPQAPYATLRRLTYKPAAPTNTAKGAFHVTGHYSSAQLTQTDRDKSVLDPKDRPARITVKSRKVMESYDKDISGNALVTAANDQFDPPPERPVTRWVFHVVKNVPSVPTWFLDYEESRNDADFSIKGVTVPKGCARLSDINISDDLVENGFTFLQLSFEIEVKAAPSGGNYKNGASGDSPRPDYTPEGWTSLFLNAGLYQINDDGDKVRCTDDNGDNAVSPKLLDESGKQIAAPTPGDAIFLCWETHPAKDFSVLPVT